MKKIITVAGILVLFAAICSAKDVVVEPRPTTPTRTDTLTQSDPTFGLVEKNLNVGSFKPLKNKIPPILDLTTGPSCNGCSGPHDCCVVVCVKQCR